MHCKVFKPLMRGIIIAYMVCVPVSSAAAPFERKVVIKTDRACNYLVTSVIIHISRKHTVVALSLILSADAFCCKGLIYRQLSAIEPHRRDCRLSIVAAYRYHVRCFSVKICDSAQKPVNPVSVTLIIAPRSDIAARERIIYCVYRRTVTVKHGIILITVKHSAG